MISKQKLGNLSLGWGFEHVFENNMGPRSLTQSSVFKGKIEEFAASRLIDNSFEAETRLKDKNITF